MLVCVEIPLLLGKNHYGEHGTDSYYSVLPTNMSNEGYLEILGLNKIYSDWFLLPTMWPTASLGCYLLFSGPST